MNPENMRGSFTYNVKDYLRMDRTHLLQKSPLSVRTLALVGLSMVGCGQPGGSSDPSTTGATTNTLFPSNGATPSIGSFPSSAAMSTKVKSSQLEPSSSAANSSGANSTEQPELTISINFRGEVNGEAFACGKTYDNVGIKKTTVQAHDFRFYVHDVRFIRSDGQEIPLKMDQRSPWQDSQVALVDFENNDGACRFGGDPATNSTVSGKLPAGEYKGVKFSNSIPSKLNHSDPLTLGAPFQAGGMAWNWLAGYKFFAVHLQTPQQDASVKPGVGLLHIGSTACAAGEAGAIACKKSNRNTVHLPLFKIDEHDIVVDVGKLFQKSDLSVDTQCHSGSSPCEPMFSISGVDWETGNPTTSQRLYSIGKKRAI